MNFSRVQHGSARVSGNQAKLHPRPYPSNLLSERSAAQVWHHDIELRRDQAIPRFSFNGVGDAVLVRIFGQHDVRYRAPFMEDLRKKPDDPGFSGRRREQNLRTQGLSGSMASASSSARAPIP
jgi:hypothetical protein